MALTGPGYTAHSFLSDRDGVELAFWPLIEGIKSLITRGCTW